MAEVYSSWENCWNDRQQLLIHHVWVVAPFVGERAELSLGACSVHEIPIYTHVYHIHI